MADQLVRLHLKEPDLLVVGVLCTETARAARELHRCLPTSAAFFAEALAAGFGIAGLLGDNARINLQLTCDGPLKGLFVDADAQGRTRGYVRNPSVNFLDSAPSAALGRDGALSVLRDLQNGEIYRGAIGLEHLELSRDLERYYRESDQLETLVRVEVTAAAEEPLGRVAALFVQRMPSAEEAAVERVRAALADQPLEAAGPRGPARAFDLTQPVARLFSGDWELHAEYPLVYDCGCSAERVLRAVTAMGRPEIEDMLVREGRAVATCAFCNKTYEVSADELRRLLAKLGAGPAQ
ncbi:MAG TPA: molecular chaperone Hsp33 [Myxococcales bacterium]|nr:molecular chaperone Hsp33 [Myxococcales bacterium]